MSTLTFGFIGLGLIGGSIAGRSRQNLPQSQIIAYDIQMQIPCGRLPSVVLPT